MVYSLNLQATGSAKPEIHEVDGSPQCYSLRIRRQPSQVRAAGAEYRLFS